MYICICTAASSQAEWCPRSEGQMGMAKRYSKSPPFSMELVPTQTVGMTASPKIVKGLSVQTLAFHLFVNVLSVNKNKTKRTQHNKNQKQQSGLRGVNVLHVVSGGLDPSKPKLLALFLRRPPWAWGPHQSSHLVLACWGRQKRHPRHPCRSHRPHLQETKLSFVIHDDWSWARAQATGSWAPVPLSQGEVILQSCHH